MSDHQENIDDGSFTCSKCSYQSKSRDNLVKHISKAHGIQVQEKCNHCDNNFETVRDLNRHITENHKSHKPCYYFKEDRCDLDDECRFKHIKLKHGEQICYTCGKIFKIKNEMLSHIIEKHGNTVCHRFLKNECTVRRCLFSHKISTAKNVEISTTQRLTLYIMCLGIVTTYFGLALCEKCLAAEPPLQQPMCNVHASTIPNSLPKSYGA